MTGGQWNSPWLWWVLGVHAFVGVCWLPVVAIQIRLRDGARAARTVDGLGTDFHRLFGLWFILGWPAFAGVMVLFALMLLRGWFG